MLNRSGSQPGARPGPPLLPQEESDTMYFLIRRIVRYFKQRKQQGS